jgi:prepilin-type N-terminal cleavage/methylation domain-containing protein
MNTIHKHSTNSRRSTGFSLIELCTVIAIMCVLTGLSVTLLGPILSGRDLNKALTLTGGVVENARQQAITRGVSIALLLITSTQSATNTSTQSQSLVLLAYDQAAATWNSITTVIQLPTSIQITPYLRDSVSSFYAYSSSSSQIPSLPSTLNGKTLANFSYIVFNPDGSVNAPTAGPALNVLRTRRQNVSSTSDYVLLIQEDTGRMKVIEE